LIGGQLPLDQYGTAGRVRTVRTAVLQNDPIQGSRCAPLAIGTNEYLKRTATVSTAGQATAFLRRLNTLPVDPSEIDFKKASHPPHSLSAQRPEPFAASTSLMCLVRYKRPVRAAMTSRAMHTLIHCVLLVATERAAHLRRSGCGLSRCKIERMHRYNARVNLLSKSGSCQSVSA
jgi:hypothetical protein